MRLKLFFFTCFLLLQSVFIIAAQSVNIKGNIDKYKNSVVWVCVTQDYITSTEIVLKETETDSVGNFSVTINLPTTDLIIIKTSDRRGVFFAEPNGVYDLKLGIPDSNTAVIIGKEPQVELSLLSNNKSELNNRINYFESLLDTFYVENNILFSKPRVLQKKYHEFKQQVKSKIGDEQSAYFLNYVKYSLAPIEEAVFQNKNYCVATYFSTPSLYHHIAYMRYFNSFYNQYFKILSSSTKGDLLLANINEMHSYALVMQTIGAIDTLLKKDTLRELVLLKCLQQSYYNKGMNKQSIEMIVSYIAQNGLGADNKLIAKNLLSNLNALEVGKIAPLVVLNHSKYKSTADFKGNLVCLIFWATWNAESLQELKLLQKLNAKYGHRVSFVAVDMGNQITEANNFVAKNKIDFYIVNDTTNEISKQFNVKSVPYAILIDEDGDILKTQAALPSNNLENLLKQLIKRKK